jgi:hypothetical protein
MANAAFTKPVNLYFRATGGRMVASAWEAKEVLLENWPGWARANLPLRA